MIGNVARISCGLMMAFWASGAFAMCARDLGKDNGGYQVIENTCSYHIMFGWQDEGACHGGNGCLTGINGHSRTLVTGMHGRVRVAECPGNICTPHFR